MPGLHDRLHGSLAALELGVAGIRCHAGSVLRSEIFQIRRREDSDRHIHAAAFVAHQFLRSQVNLIDLWLSVMAAIQATVTREHNEHLLQCRKRQQEHLKAVVDDLDTSVFGLIRDVRDVTEADGLPDAAARSAEWIRAEIAALDAGREALKLKRRDLPTHVRVAEFGEGEMLDELNRTGTVFPGTGLRMDCELPEIGAEPGEVAS